MTDTDKRKLLAEMVYEIYQSLPGHDENPHALHEFIKNADRLQDNTCNFLSYQWGRLLGAAEFNGMEVLELLDFYEVAIYFDAEDPIKPPLGKEAEELRSEIEALIATCDLVHGPVYAKDLQAVLDSVNARDSLAYLRGKDPSDEFTAEEWAKAEAEGRCNPGCRGWAHFNIGEDREEIEACMDCGIFETDEEAGDVHDKHCACGAHAGKAIMFCHQCNHSTDDHTVTIDDERAFCSKACADYYRHDNNRQG